MSKETIKIKRLLTDLIKQIAQEKTELIKDENEGDRIATKAEALARLIWKKALGYQEVDPKTQMLEVFKPDKDMIALIYDRMEGKAGIGDISGQGDNIPRKISDLNKQKLNKLATDVRSDDNS